MIDDMAARTARILNHAPRPLMHWISLGLIWAGMAGAVVILGLAATRHATLACGAC